MRAERSRLLNLAVLLIAATTLVVSCSKGDAISQGAKMDTTTVRSTCTS
jgi:hypothetical protein